MKKIEIKCAETGKVFTQNVEERTVEQVQKFAERVARTTGKVIEITERPPQRVDKGISDLL